LNKRKYVWYGYDDGGPGALVVPGFSPGFLGHARLVDILQQKNKNVRMEYETAVVAKASPDEGKVYASMSWGVLIDKDRHLSAYGKHFHDEPPQFWWDAVSMWNKQAWGMAGEKNSPDQEAITSLVTGVTRIWLNQGWGSRNRINQGWGSGGDGQTFDY